MNDSPAERRLFTAYALPLPARRQGPATLLSLVAHVTIAALVMWRGAALLAGGGEAGLRGGGGGAGSGRPAVNWLALPAPSTPQAADVPAPPEVPTITVPTLALETPEIARLEVPLVAAMPAVGAAGVAGGAGAGPGAGGGKGTGTGTGRGADQGPGSGGDASYIVPASPRWTYPPPPGWPQDARGRYEVRFWVTADGRVTRVEVTPPIKDARYRRDFVEKMMGYVFNPATTRDGRRVASVATVIITF